MTCSLTGSGVTAPTAPLAYVEFEEVGPTISRYGASLTMLGSVSLAADASTSIGVSCGVTPHTTVAFDGVAVTLLEVDTLG